MKYFSLFRDDAFLNENDIICCDDELRIMPI